MKDTTDFNKIKQQHKISKDVLLILIDFRLLYTNIPHNKGLQAVKQSLKKRLSTISTNVHFIYLIYYLQTKGCGIFIHKKIEHPPSLKKYAIRSSIKNLENLTMPKKTAINYYKH